MIVLICSIVTLVCGAAQLGIRWGFEKGRLRGVCETVEQQTEMPTWAIGKDVDGQEVIILFPAAGYTGQEYLRKAMHIVNVNRAHQAFNIRDEHGDRIKPLFIDKE